MRIPKPKSAPGLFLYGITAAAAVLLLRILWVLVGQNIEVVSTEKGWDSWLKNHLGAIVLWLSENMFWLSLTTAAVIGSAAALWIYVAIQPAPLGAGVSSEDGAPYRLKRLEENIIEAFKGLGAAIGSNMPIQYKLSLSQAEPILLDLERLNGVAVPRVEGDSDRLKCLRTLVYLTEMKPMLQRDDLPGTRERAAEIVPRINAMTVEELNGLFEFGADRGRY